MLSFTATLFLVAIFRQPRCNSGPSITGTAIEGKSSPLTLQLGCDSSADVFLRKEGFKNKCIWQAADQKPIFTTVELEWCWAKVDVYPGKFLSCVRLWPQKSFAWLRKGTLLPWPVLSLITQGGLSFPWSFDLRPQILTIYCQVHIIEYGFISCLCNRIRRVQGRVQGWPRCKPPLSMSLLQSKGAGIDYLYGPFRLHRFIDPNAIEGLGRVPDPWDWMSGKFIDPNIIDAPGRVPDARDCASGGSQSLCLRLGLFHFPC